MRASQRGLDNGRRRSGTGGGCRTFPAGAEIAGERMTATKATRGSRERRTAARKSAARQGTRRRSDGRRAAKRRTARPTARPRKTQRPAARKWSQRVTRESDALDLERGVFSQKDPKRIAASLKRSAERSRRRKSDPFRSALSMLTFYVNRAGRKLPAGQKKVLQRAKDELRKQFGRA